MFYQSLAQAPYKNAWSIPLGGVILRFAAVKCTKQRTLRVGKVGDGKRFYRLRDDRRISHAESEGGTEEINACRSAPLVAPYRLFY